MKLNSSRFVLYCVLKNHFVVFGVTIIFRTCTLSSIVVSPNYIGTSPDFTKCYTRKRRDIAYGANVSSTGIYGTKYKAKYAVDGIYLKNLGNTFRLKRKKKPWVVFDHGQTATILKIIIRSKYDNICSKYEMRIGDSMIVDNDCFLYCGYNSSNSICEQMESTSCISHQPLK